MVSLETHLNSMRFATQLEEIKNLIDIAQVKTTFWGSRVVEVNGFTGSIYLRDLSIKILEVGIQRVEADDLTTEERIAGIEIVKQVKRFYETTDVQIQNSNLFTRFLNWIREFYFTPYTARFYIEEIAEERFRAYSPTKFLQEFGGAFDQNGDHPASNGSIFPSRVLAKENLIRALLSPV